MAQAVCLSNAVRAPITGVEANSSTNPIRAAHADLVTVLAAQRPWPVFADASDLENRADHLKAVLDALSTYLTAILDDTAQNVPGGLELRQIDALSFGIASQIPGTIRSAADDIAGRAA